MSERVCLGTVTAHASVPLALPDIDLDDESAVLAAIAERALIEKETKAAHVESLRLIVDVRYELEGHLRELQRDSLIFIINGVDVITKIDPAEPMRAARDRALSTRDDIVIDFAHYMVRDMQGCALPLKQRIDFFNFPARTRLFLLPLPPEER